LYFAYSPTHCFLHFGKICKYFGNMYRWLLHRAILARSRYISMVRLPLAALLIWHIPYKIFRIEKVRYRLYCCSACSVIVLHVYHVIKALCSLIQLHWHWSMATILKIILKEILECMGIIVGQYTGYLDSRTFDSK
jgi:hypothetical protein